MSNSFVQLSLIDHSWTVLIDCWTVLEHCWCIYKTVGFNISNIKLFCICWKQMEHCSEIIGKRCICTLVWTLALDKLFLSILWQEVFLCTLNEASGARIRKITEQVASLHLHWLPSFLSHRPGNHENGEKVLSFEYS